MTLQKVRSVYIELPENSILELSRLQKLLRDAGFIFYDATGYDSYTSGPCALNSVIDIAHDLQAQGELVQ